MSSRVPVSLRSDVSSTVLLQTLRPALILAAAAVPGTDTLERVPACRLAGCLAEIAPDRRDAMVRRGWLQPDTGGGWQLSGRLLRGTIAFTRGGSGFVATATGDEEVFVPAEATGTALHGDLVLAWMPRPSPQPRNPARLAEAMVVDVLERRRTSLLAQVCQDGRGSYGLPLDPRGPQRLRLDPPVPGSAGTWVRIELDPWTDPRQLPSGRVAEVIGPDHHPATDDHLVAAEYALPEAFPLAVLTEAEQVRHATAASPDRLDLRDRFVVTIDPADSKDFDDALSVRQLGKDLWELAVHVADVSHFVHPDSALDREALARGCSVYLPGRVIPMLPEVLSNDVCSLNPNVDRMAFTALLHVTGEGVVKNARFAPSIIRSRRRLTYAEALVMLTAPPPTDRATPALERETVATVRQLGRLAQALGARRHAAGALELASRELRLVLDPTGRVSRLETVAQDDAHRLVEECMLAANEYACRTLAAAGVSQLHRLHPEPEYARLETACESLRAAGVTQACPQDRGDLVRLLSELAAQADGSIWTTSLLRALPRATYAVDRMGHFGLAKTHYAHFTSPIRRYPDLVTHRLLKAVLRGETPRVPAAGLRAVALTCSEREREAQRAERHLSEAKRLRWLATTARQNPAGLDAVVTDLGERGADLYLPAYGLFGWLPRARIAGSLRPGQHLRVQPARLDAARRTLELMDAQGGQPPARSPRPTPTRRARRPTPTHRG